MNKEDKVHVAKLVRNNNLAKLNSNCHNRPEQLLLVVELVPLLLQLVVGHKLAGELQPAKIKSNTFQIKNCRRERSISYKFHFSYILFSNFTTPY